MWNFSKSVGETPEACVLITFVEWHDQGVALRRIRAVGARTSKIEIGTGVIDMRYENPFYMAEDAGSADLIAGGRLQLGISRGSPEQVIDGWKHFGYAPGEGEDGAEMARCITASIFSLRSLSGPGTL